MMTRTLLIACLAAAALPALAQERFSTPEAALEALAKAVAADDRAALGRLLGPDYPAFYHGQQADPSLRDMRFKEFARALAEFRSLSVDAEDRRTLVIGAQGWPFPVPLVRSGRRWHFDGKAGLEELRNRIVGANELNAIAVLDVYTEAQRSYAREDYDGDGAVEYAQRIASTPGQRDGLYWDDDPEDPDAEPSPLGPLIGLAELAMGERRAGEPFLGYRYRILTSQGAQAKAGAYEYVINGHMVAGFAAIAWPASRGDTGVMTFIVNQDGVIYQRDLGPDTATAAAAITRFDPGEGWSAVLDDDLLGDQAASR